MPSWQRRARTVIALCAILFAMALALTFRSRVPASTTVSVVRMDPDAIVEGSGGQVDQFKGTHEVVSVGYDKMLSYSNGSSKLIGVKVTTTNRAQGRTFTIAAKEGHVEPNRAGYTFDGNVTLAASDGLTAKTEHATYTDSDGMVRAPGPVEMLRGRLSGNGLGLTYDNNQDVLTILSQAVVHVVPDEHGTGAAAVTSDSAIFARRDKIVRFERGVDLRRTEETMTADAAVAHLSDDQNRIEAIELRGHSRIEKSHADPGGLQSLTGRDVDLTYGASGQSLERASVSGDGVIQLAGSAGTEGRRIMAATIDVALAADGATPTLLSGRDGVELLFPADQASGARTIQAAALDGKGEPGRGLTEVHFTGNVRYREVNGSMDRVARSEALDVTLKPGMSAIEEARFAHDVRFEEGGLAAAAAMARYLLDSGVLELTSPEAGQTLPHVVNEQIKIDATRIDVTLAGPKMKAIGRVSSELRSAAKDKGDQKGGERQQTARKMPSLLKQDQPTYVTGDQLSYDGTASKAMYNGAAKLWQADTVIQGDALVIDDKSGDLSAAGSVATSIMLDQVNSQTKAKERVRTNGTAKEFAYDDAQHRATYLTEAHLIGPDGDMTAVKIELYLKESGNELDHAEGYDDMTLRENGRTTTGNRMSYFSADGRYLGAGTPVRLVDACGRETTGRTMTFYKASDKVIVDGKQQTRTQTKGGGKCP